MPLNLSPEPGGEAPARAADDAAAPVTLNKKLLAAKLNISLPTLNARLEGEWSDMPVLQRGASGTEWQFDGAAVSAYLAAYTERRSEQDRAFAEQQRALALPIDMPADDAAWGLDPTKRLALAKARAAEWDAARRAGFLVPTQDVRQSLNAAFAALSRDLQAMIRQMGRDHEFSEADLQDAEGRLRAVQSAFIQRAGNLFAGAPDGGGPDLFSAL